MNNQKPDIAITLDTDWAPDCALRMVTDLLINANISATWFTTHDTPLIQQWKKHPSLFELGIHPNFLAGSTQGGTEDEIIDTMVKLIPEAVSMRTHALFQSGPLLAKIKEKTSVQYDSSQFLPEATHVEPVQHLTPSGVLHRLPFIWADDYEMMKEEPQWDLSGLLKSPGKKVIMFHPIHLLLNSSSFQTYETLKSSLPNLNQLSYRDCEPFKNNTERGSLDAFKSLLKENPSRFLKFKDLVQS